MTSEVVRYFRRKNDSATDFEPITWLGAEQRFVNALRNSSNNNLEEQYVFGTDTYTEIEEDADGNQIITKSFCILPNENSKPSDTNNYYCLETIKYSQAANDYFFDDNMIKMPYSPGDVHFGISPNENTIFYEDEKTFNFNNSTLTISSTSVLQKDKLYFVQNDGVTKLPIAEKQIKVSSEGNKQIIREIVTKLLNS